MTEKEIQDLLQRARRIQQKSEQKAGKGTSWTVQSSAGDTYYEFKNIVSSGDVLDAAATAAVWTYSIKDYAKKKLIAQGKDPQQIETFVKSNQDLAITADIANSEKHDGLDKPSKSGRNPELGKPNFSVPQKGIASISILGNAVITDVSDPETVEILLPIYADNGDYLGDAFEIFSAALEAWESYLPSL